MTLICIAVVLCVLFTSVSTTILFDRWLDHKEIMANKREPYVSQPVAEEEKE